jgi:hypothetical protein
MDNRGGVDDDQRGHKGFHGVFSRAIRLRRRLLARARRHFTVRPFEKGKLSVACSLSSPADQALSGGLANMPNQHSFQRPSPSLRHKHLPHSMLR